jgi:drug/metabolite transporter (DMT)-like permease
MCVASISFSLMATLIRVLSARLSGLEITIFRSAIGSIVLILFLRWKKISVLGNHRKELNARGVIGSIANTFYFISLTGGNLAEIVCLIRTSTLMIPFIALWTLSEKIKMRHYFCSVAGFLGTLLIIKPGAVEFNGYSVAALLCAIFGALSWTSVRSLAQKEHPGVICLYLYFFSTIAAVLLMLMMKDPFVTLNSMEWFYMVCLITVGLSAQFALVMAYRHAPAAVVSPVAYSEIVFTAILGWVIFGQAIGLFSAIGIIIILLSATLIQNPVEAFINWQRGRGVKDVEDVEEVVLPLPLA